MPSQVLFFPTEVGPVRYPRVGRHVGEDDTALIPRNRTADCGLNVTGH